MPENPPPTYPEDSRGEKKEDPRSDGPPSQSVASPPQEEGRFSGISRQRWIELMQHYAEIQRYQREHGLEDKGDPPPDNLPRLPSSQ